MRRSIAAAGIVATIATSTGAGWVAATRVKSPAKISAEAAPPLASLITYPVEKRVLSSDLIVRGTMRYSDPIVVVLAPSALRPPPVLVSEPPVKGATLEEGDVALVVSGRPVFAIVGATPNYRDLGPGAVGTDVQQLEEFLDRGGFTPGTVDGRFDGSTGAAVTKWYADSGYQALGPNDQQRASILLAESTLSQATDRLLQARQADLLNRSGAKPADLVDARAAVAAAKAAVVAARNTASRDAARGQSDLALKEADLLNKQADVTTKQAAVEGATIALEEARRRDALAASGASAATGVVVTPEQLALLQEGLDEATAAVTAAEGDLTAAEAIANTVRITGEAAVAEARVRASAASTYITDGLTPQELLAAAAAGRTAQAAVVLAEATATKDNAVAAADISAKKSILTAAQLRATRASQRIETAKTGVDPATGLKVSSAGDRANSQLAVKQAELAVRQAEIVLSPAQAVLLAAQGEIDSLREVNALTAEANQDAIDDAQARVKSASERIVALNRPGAGGKTLSQAVTVAEAEVSRLRAELNKTVSAIGVQVPANELVFLPSLPLRIDDTKVKRGDSASVEVMTVSGTRFAVDAALLTTEAPLTQVGAAVTIEAPEYDYKGTGKITFLADKPGLRGTDAQHIAIEVSPTDAAVQLVGASVRLTIPTKTTKGEALIVPVSALSVRADGSTQLQIEESSGSVRTVIVTAGLSAQGFVEIVPLKGSVNIGDRVVIGAAGFAPTETSAAGPPASSVASESPSEPQPTTTIGGDGERAVSTSAANPS